MKVTIEFDTYGDLFRASAWLGARVFTALSSKSHEDAKTFLVAKLRQALKDTGGTIPGERRKEVVYL